MGRPDGYAPIGDYAVIGDCRSAALVSRSGSLDWLCLPRFDSPAIFAGLLDRRNGGFFAVHPTGDFISARQYIRNSNVLRTTFTTPKGRIRLTDLVPVASEAEKRCELWPEHQVLRMVECLEGQVEVEVIWDPRLCFGRKAPRIKSRGKLGFCIERGADAIMLRSEIPLQLSDPQPGARGRAVLNAGDRRFVSFIYTDGEIAVIPTFGPAAERKIDHSVRWWQNWASRCKYGGPYQDEVIRSALVLKLMCYAPSGAVVAAPTTSLPEEIGGVRNWDYRYCWLRDASLTLQALVDLGYEDEAQAFLSWMLYSTRLSRPELKVLYDVHGETRTHERELDYLEGYRNSKPVHVGNGADKQFQLDTYGEVVDAVYEFVSRGGRLGSANSRMLIGLGKTVCRRWREPDNGLWEIRGKREHHTYSKALCWLALHRLLQLHEGGHLSKGWRQAPIESFARARDNIHEAIEAHGYNEDLGSYVGVFGGDQLDASLLLLGRHGYEDPRSPRMVGTRTRIYERLGRRGLLYRYHMDDGLPGQENTFGACSFWGIDSLCRQGELEQATELFEHVCGFANDVGLFSEEINAETGELVGNFPQAFTHIGLIDTALTLAERKEEAPRRTGGMSSMRQEGRS